MQLIWTVLLFVAVSCDNSLSSKSILVSATLHSPALTEVTFCENGVLKNKKCECPTLFTGKFCERSINCAGPTRLNDGSCVKCQNGYTGPLCDVIVCAKGERNHDETCTCTKPYSGKFCDILDTKDIYLHYNRMICRYGPIGAFMIIPMIVAMFACSRTSKKRQVKRAEFAYEHQNTNDINKHSITQPLTSVNQ